MKKDNRMVEVIVNVGIAMILWAICAGVAAGILRGLLTLFKVM